MGLLEQTLNFIPKTLESALNFTNRNLASALNYTENKVSDYFQPDPNKVRIRDVFREAQDITSKLAPTQEQLATEYEKAKPTVGQGKEIPQRITTTGIIFKKGDKAQ